MLHWGRMKCKWWRNYFLIWEKMLSTVVYFYIFLDVFPYLWRSQEKTYGNITTRRRFKSFRERVNGDVVILIWEKKCTPSQWYSRMSPISRSALEMLIQWFSLLFSNLEEVQYRNSLPKLILNFRITYYN